MIYRNYGQMGFKSSLLGLGCMRLPRDEKTGEIDLQQSTAIIRHAIDSGINYVDTAYGYPGSEVALGNALKDGYRKKVKIATKLPAQEVKNRSDVREKFMQQLQRLGTDHIDFYLIHRVENTTWAYVRECGIIEEYRKLKQEGLVGGIGFSYHDNFEVFKEVLDYTDWDMCQVQQNYLDVDREVTDAGIRYAGKKGVALVIMEPLRGGALATLPQEMLDIFKKHAQKRTPIEWAFRHLYNYPEVSCILSGMSTMDQLTENLRYFQNRRDVYPECMSINDAALLRNAKQILDKKMLIGCTGCFYCMPCPSGVGIPNLFGAYNAGSVFDNWIEAKRRYGFARHFGSDATKCVECGQCESICPQHLPIIQTLKQLHVRLT